MKKYAAMCLALAWWAGMAQASTLTIDVGDHPLLANTAGQTVPLYVSGGVLVNFVLVDCQVGDGGPLTGGPLTGPTITNLDVVSGTIFADNNEGNAYDSGGRIVPQVAHQGTITNYSTNGFVTANGLLATVTIDTTGFFTLGSSWELKLKGTLNGDTSFGEDVPAPVITNGTIRLAPASEVPEAGTLALVAAGAGMLLWRRKAS